MRINFAVIVPMANEEEDFVPFIRSLTKVFNTLECGKAYFVVDCASKDKTLQLCNNLSLSDARFVTVWAPENKNVVDAYLRGYKAAVENSHDLIIEMDAGMSHDPNALPMFLNALCEGHDCVFGSRFMDGGSISDSSWKRFFLSRVGTIVSNLLLGTRMYDMTSGYQGFRRDIVEKFLSMNLLSEAHFYQTELRYLLRKTKYIEVPIHYRAPSPRVSKKAVFNAVQVLFHYFIKRVQHNAPFIR